MFKVRLFCIILGFGFLFLDCAGSAASKDTDAQEAAMDALASMERAFGGEPVSLPTGAAAPAAANAPANTGGTAAASSREKPAWVDAPDTVYSRQRFISAVGYGSDRLQAERSALTSLTAVFGQSIQAELQTVTNYSEAVKNKTIQITENNSVQDAITTSVEMDSLMGAQIADVWFDNRSTYYAVAIMEKEKSAILYADLIRSNERIITELVTMGNDEKNSLYGYSRYLLAADIADANRVYANVLTLVSSTSAINTGNMKKGEDYRIGAMEIARNIPISVNVEGDSSGRIRGAFSRALSSMGFRGGMAGSRYVLQARLSITDAELPGQNIFLRYTVDADLTDTAENSVLLPFNINGREGHINRSEAEERVLRTAEQQINGNYGKYLQDYLAILLPGRK